MKEDLGCRSQGTTPALPKRGCGIGQPTWQLVDWCTGCAPPATQGHLRDIGACSCVSPTSFEFWSLPPAPGPLSPSIVLIDAPPVAGCWGRHSIQLKGDFPSASRKGTPLWTRSFNCYVQILPGADTPPSCPADS